jgi:predicted phosphoadenosine phosphosulfate sulfurtransferase
LDTLWKIQWKFLLSNYPSVILEAYARRNDWFVVYRQSKIIANNSNQSRKDKTEVLVANYPIE